MAKRYHQKRKEPRLFVLVKGSRACAERAARKRDITWTSERRGKDCRVSPHETGGHVPMSDFDKVVRWYCEDNDDTSLASGACLFYTRVEG